MFTQQNTATQHRPAWIAICCLQIVEQAFSEKELDGTHGKSFWQQCCVAAVLDGKGPVCLAMCCSGSKKMLPSQDLLLHTSCTITAWLHRNKETQLVGPGLFSLSSRGSEACGLSPQASLAMCARHAVPHSQPAMHTDRTHHPDLALQPLYTPFFATLLLSQVTAC
jgi:hypothetical protein